jgi:GT2 family glycosyltransferase
MNDSNPSDLFIVVLAWNHIEDTRECLKSFAQSAAVDFRLVVIDNGSNDGTSEIIRREFPEVDIIRAETNLGVAGGYNLGIDYALNQGAQYILIANNDIAVDTMMASHLIEFLRCSNPAVGIAMPKIYHYYGNRSKIWTVGAYWRRFPPTVKMMGLNKLDQGEYTSPQSIEFAPSCCYMIRRAVAEKIGGFDSHYFFYFDDWDYSARARQAGFAIWLVPAAQMWHKVSISTQKSDKPFKWWKAMGKSAYRFYTLHYSRVQLAEFTLWYILREIIKLKPIRSAGFIAGVWEEIRGAQTASRLSQPDSSAN